MSTNLDRGILLFDQSRYKQAEDEFRQAIAVEPRQAYAHAMLGLCLSYQQRYDEAETEVREAIHLEPGLAWAHYAHACVLHERNDFSGSRKAVDEAIRLDPGEVEYYAMLAAVCFSQRQWSAALGSAEIALSLDAEHVRATNLRAMALVKLGRKIEAGAAIETALAKNPEDSVTHANQGWTLLEQGQPHKALEHFKESLRLDPQNEWAAQGILEAMKARNMLYAVMLKYFLWMSKLSSGVQWAIILVGMFGSRFLRSVSKSQPELAPWIMPIQILYLVFVMLTWTARPIFNLLLRLDPFGRLVLSSEQKREANLVGVCFLFAAVSLLLGFLVHGALLIGALVFAVIAIPVAGTFSCESGWARKTMTVITLVIATLGIGAVTLLLLEGPGTNEAPDPLGGLAMTIFPFFFIAVVVSQFLGNFLAGRTSRK